MNPEETKISIEAIFNAGKVPFLHGGPGIGKSSIVKQVAEELELQLIDVRASLLDPVDLMGVPTVENGVTKWCTPEMLPTKGAGIFFVDELNLGTKAVQNSFYQLILDRKLGKYTLPDGWKVIAAGNRPQDGCGISPMSPPLANRFINLYVEPSIRCFVDWGLKHNINGSILGLLDWRPSLLYNFNKKVKSEAFCTPRSWCSVSDILKQDIQENLYHEIITGTVGEGAALEFQAYLKMYRGLPRIEDIEASPDTHPIPEQGNVLYALTYVLAQEKTTRKNAKKIIRFVSRFPVEFISTYLNILTAVKPELYDIVINTKEGTALMKLFIL